MTKAETVVSLFEAALHHDKAMQDLDRAQAKGGQGKTNPYITDAGDECERRIWYTLRNYPVTEPYTTDSLANFLLGKSAEEGFARVLEQYPDVKVIREVRVELKHGDHVVTGRSDFLLFVPADSILIEMKTTTRMAMKMNGYKPYPSHASQLNLYLEAAHRGLLEGLRATETGELSGVVFYYLKDAKKRQKTFYAFDLEWSHAEAMNDLDRLVALHSTALAYPDMVPDRPKGVDPEKYPCGYCSFKTGCWTRNWSLTPEGSVLG